MTLGCQKDLFFYNTDGTAGTIFNVLDCKSRQPVLVENRFKIVSTVILSLLLPQLEQLYVSCERVGTQ